MNSLGILYTKEMILAKKAGLKTVTRRPIKFEKIHPTGEYILVENKNGIATFTHTYSGERYVKVCDYAKAVDYLYTKENFQIIDDMPFEQTVKVRYKADGESRWVQLTDAEWEKWQAWKQPYAKKSKLFMFKSLSRFWDKITAIDVERVQDISAEEVWNEGLRLPDASMMDGLEHIEMAKSKELLFTYSLPEEKLCPCTEYPQSYITYFMFLWEKMYAGTDQAWENNPWVWVIRCQPVNLEKQEMKAELR